MLTVVIPSYNHEKYVLDCLTAVLNIKIQGIKILIIDDGSTDKSLSILKKFIVDNREYDIELIQKANSGLVSSLNLALDRVRTEFIYICASDDVPVPAGIEQCFQTLASKPNLEFCIGGAINFSDDGGLNSSAYRVTHDKFFALDFEKNKDKLFLDYPAPILIQSTLFRVSALRSVGGWDKELIWDDFTIFIKLLSKFKIGMTADYLFSPGITVVMYRHHGSNTYSNTLNQLKILKQAVLKLAPPKIAAKVIDMKMVYYFAVALKRRDYGAARQIFSESSLMTKVKAPLYLMNIFLKR